MLSIAPQPNTSPAHSVDLRLNGLAQQSKTQGPKFSGSLATAELAPITKMARTAYDVIAGDPGRRIIFMDLIGWCGLRTLIDYHRETFYWQNVKQHLPWTKAADDDHLKPKGNEAAAVERVKREVRATVNDILLAGPAAALLATGLDQTASLYTADFIEPNVLDLLHKQASKLAEQPELAKLSGHDALHTLYQGVHEALGQDLSAQQKATVANLLTPEVLAKYAKPQTGLLKGVSKLLGGQGNTLEAEPLIHELAKALGHEGDFSTQLVIKGAEASDDQVIKTTLPDLLTNLHKFQGKFLAHEQRFTAKGTHWASDLAQHLSISKKVRLALPLLLVGVTAYNIITSHQIQAETVKDFGITSFPGEIGYGDKAGRSKQEIVSDYENQPWNEKYFGYLTKAFENKNPLPFLGAAALLPIVLGAYRVGNGFALPEQLSVKGVKRFFKQMALDHDYASKFPFSSDQQQATTYMATLFGRIITARTPAEFTMHLMDSVPSFWSAFEFTPAVEGKVAKLISTPKSALAKLQKAATPGLVKTSGALKTDAEIMAIKDPIQRKATLGAQTWMNWGLFGATTLLMGVVEPITSIFLSSLMMKQEETTTEGLQPSKQSEAPSHTATKIAAPANVIIEPYYPPNYEQLSQSVSSTPVGVQPVSNALYPPVPQPAIGLIP